MSISLIAPGNEFKVQGLLAAFDCDQNAHARCIEFASRADGEGLHGIASLFRATARAKQIHAGNHAHVIRQLGGEPVAQAHALEVTSTLDNLRAELASEDRAVAFYAELLGNTALDDSASRTLRWALEADKPRAQSYREAIALLETGERSSWIGTARTFYVRQACGSTSEQPQPARCWACDEFCATFETVG